MDSMRICTQYQKYIHNKMKSTHTNRGITDKVTSEMHTKHVRYIESNTEVTHKHMK
jgi:hypothetical protein